MNPANASQSTVCGLAWKRYSRQTPLRNVAPALNGRASLAGVRPCRTGAAGKARIEAPSVKGEAHRPHTEALGSSAQTRALRFMLILEEPRGGQERKQDSEDDPEARRRIGWIAFHQDAVETSRYNLTSSGHVSR